MVDADYSLVDYDVMAVYDERKKVVKGIFMVMVPLPECLIDLIVVDYCCEGEEVSKIQNEMNKSLRWIDKKNKLLRKFSKWREKTITSYNTVFWDYERHLAIFAYDMGKLMRENKLVNRAQRIEFLRFMAAWKLTILKYETRLAKMDGAFRKCLKNN